MTIWGEGILGKGRTENTKTLGWEHTRNVQATARKPVCLEQKEKRIVGNGSEEYLVSRLNQGPHQSLYFRERKSRYPKALRSIIRK